MPVSDFGGYIGAAFGRCKTLLWMNLLISYNFPEWCKNIGTFVGDQTGSTMEIRGIVYYPGFLPRDEQEKLVGSLRKIVEKAPLITPETPFGQMSVRMTSAGLLGWLPSKKGYGYQDRHPTGDHWPSIPDQLLDVWGSVSNCTESPDSCLVNYYEPSAKMGMHQDKDERDTAWPVVSISLGDDALFRIGNLTRGGKTDKLWLKSGDVVVLGGEGRMLYHGIDRIAPNTSTLLPKPGRINVTLRKAG